MRETLGKVFARAEAAEARVKELENALKEAVEWNWCGGDLEDIPQEVRDRILGLIGEQR